MPDLPQTIWKNLLAITSALQKAGLVVEFNGRYSEPANLCVEIDANRRDEGRESEFDESDNTIIEAKKFYSKAEYTELNNFRDYTVKFIDGAVAQYFCYFSDEKIIRQRLTFYQSPWVHPYDSKPKEYDEWLKDAEDISEEAKILFGWNVFGYREMASVRIEYAPDQYRSVIHPKTHLHLSGCEGCRIPVAGPLGAATFFRFIIKNFYLGAWERLDEKLVDVVDSKFDATIDAAEHHHVSIDIPNIA
jgi:hypothetical protein